MKMSPLDAGWIETRAPDRTGKLHYASNAMLDRIPRIGSTIYEREQVKKEEKRERERRRERKRSCGNGRRKRGAPRKRERKREKDGESERGAS